MSNCNKNMLAYNLQFAYYLEGESSVFGQGGMRGVRWIKRSGGEGSFLQGRMEVEGL